MNANSPPPPSRRGPVQLNTVTGISEQEQSTRRQSHSVPPRGEQSSATVAERIQPLEAELANIREKLTELERKWAQFDAGLSQLPSEMEERLWQQTKAEVARQTGALGVCIAEMSRQLEGAQPLGEPVTDFVRELSTRVDAVEVSLQVLVREQAAGWQQKLGELVERIGSVGQIANQTAEQLAQVSQLLRGQIAHEREHLSTVARGFTADIAALKQAVENLSQQPHREECGLKTMG